MTKKTELIGEDRRKELLLRLNRIEGQVRGVKQMIQDGRRCMEILQQISSVHEALRGVSKLMMRNYLENCGTAGIRSNDREEVEQVYQELLDMMFKFAR
jgi:DNA-binding FrmR family transcriptional regulator